MSNRLNGNRLNGERPNFAALLEEHSPWLRTVVMARLQDASAVDDVMQEVALQVLNRPQSAPDVVDEVPWLYRVAVGHALQFRRRHGRQQNHCRRYAAQGNAEQVPQGDDPASWVIAEETRERVRRAIGAMSAQDREILMLKHSQDWTYKQIADHLGISFDKVVYRLERARRRLRSRLATPGSDEPP